MLKLKTFIKVSLVYIIIFIIYSCLQDATNKEMLSCDKNKDVCVYSITTFKNKEFQKKDTFTISSIKSIKARTYTTKHRGRRGRIRYTEHYVIDLYKDNETFFPYPINLSNYNDLQYRLNKFSSYINGNEIKYSDYNDNNVEQIFMYIFFIGILISLVIIGMDVSKSEKENPKKDTSEEFTKQETKAIENIINEYSKEKNKSLSKEEIEIITSSVKYWRQHNGHSKLMKNLLTQYLSKGNGFISSDDMALDMIIYQQWQKEYPEDYKKERDEISKLNQNK